MNLPTRSVQQPPTLAPTVPRRPCRSPMARARAAVMRGFSLVELMIAMVIGLIIMYAVVQIFTATRLTYQMDEGLARLQENARFAFDFIAREVRSGAGYGCARNLRIFNNLNASPAFDFTTPVRGFDANGTDPSASGVTYAYPPGGYPPDNTAVWTPPLDTALAPAAMPGTDVLVVRRISSAPMRLRPPYADADLVYLDPSLAGMFNVNDIAIVYNCDSASVFQVSGVDVAGPNLQHAVLGGATFPDNACPSWGNDPVNCAPDPQQYNDKTEIGLIQTAVFFVARGASGTPSLWVAAYPGTTQELIEGVDNMQILYGFDNSTLAGTRSDGRVDVYLPANLITDWSRVISVRLSLLMSTVNTAGVTDAAADTNTYFLNGLGTADAVEIDPPDDNRRRRVFDTTIVLRSRAL